MLDPNAELTREKVDELLSQRFPSAQELELFPLSSVLKDIAEVDPRYYGDDKNGHIHRVMRGINILTGKTPFKITEEWDENEAVLDPICREFMALLDNFFNGMYFNSSALNTSNIKSFLRICAFYHDIGKGIITERHPTVGWHLIKDVHSKEVKEKLYPLILGKDVEKWNRNPSESYKNLTKEEKRLLVLFVTVIKYHDLFGVLSTGEASYPVMLDLIPLTGANVDEAIQLFYILFILNLADVYGSVDKIFPHKVKYFCHDLKLLIKVITECSGDRKTFFDSLVKISQKTESTIHRITRFLMEGAPKEWKEELDKDPEIINDSFKNATIAGQYRFCNNFALFCKLDYSLSFKILMMKVAKDRGKDVSSPVAKIIEYLVHLEREYGDLCMRDDGTRRRLGLQLSGLTRKPKNHNESKIGNTICKLLLDYDKGREWASSECTVWFLEE